MSESITNTVLIDNLFLNQTAHNIMNPSWRYSLFINYPYQFLRSLIYALIQQRTEAYQDRSNIFDIILAFVFSKYATLCLLTALALNDFIISRSPLYNTRIRTSRRKSLIKLSPRTQFVIQLVTVIILVYALCLPFFESNLLKCLFRRYLAFVIGYSTATTVSIVNHKMPLESADYSLFELTLQYFAFERRLMNPSLSAKKQLGEFKWIYLPDSTVSLLNLLIIHLAEYFNARKYRLVFSSVLDLINIFYISVMWYQYGSEFVPFVIKYRNFPKIFCTIVVALSLVCYGFAVLVRYNPWSKGKSRISDLQYHSFLVNWWEQLNLTGEEDYTMAVKRFDKLIYSGNNSQLLNYHKELPAITIHKDDKLIFAKGLYSNVQNNSSVISGELPSHMSSHISQRRRSSTLPHHHFLAVPLSWDICRVVFRYIQSRFSSNNIDNDTEIYDQGNDSNLQLKINLPLHEHIDEVWKEIDVEDSNYDEATDEDYILEEIISDEDNDMRYSDDEGVTENLELLDLILAGNLKQRDACVDDSEQYWLAEVTPVIGTHLLGNKRMTRSQYTKTRRDSYSQVEASSTKTNDEPIDSLCAVCKTNERSIIVWPCKCFALCENCRVSLALRGYKKCVYCRQPVAGYSKVELKHI